MFRDKPQEEGSTFWISYADLMAGLLFVFILLIGAIVSKSIILKEDLHEKQKRLSVLSENLTQKEMALLQNRELLAQKEAALQKNKAALKAQKKELQSTHTTLSQQERLLRLKSDEIEKLTRMLAEANGQKRRLSSELVVVGGRLKELNATLTKVKKESQSKIVVLTEALNDMNRTLKNKEVKVLKLLNALDERATQYDALIAKMQEQKAKIKSLTGIKLKVVAALKEALGEKIDIDKKSGSLKLASSILFDKGSATLKEEAKSALKEAFEEYIGALMQNPKIRPHLDKIIIEGHTDSDGGYLYNLELSQRRAFAVMNYLLSLEISQKYNLKPLLVASGRAYLDAIKENGVENKEASRRIEIKFRLKNEDAMHEIERVLDAK